MSLLLHNVLQGLSLKNVISIPNCLHLRKGLENAEAEETTVLLKILLEHL